MADQAARVVCIRPSDISAHSSEEMVSMLNCSDNARVCLHSLKNFDVPAFKASNGRLAL